MHTLDLGISSFNFLFENGNLGVKIMDFTLESFDLL